MSDMKTLITEVKAHDASATPGPWRRAHHGTWEVEAEPNQLVCDTGTLDRAKQDAALIAHYRTAAPILAAEVERLNAVLSSGPPTIPAHQSDDPIAALVRTIATDPRDWAQSSRDAWIYGILCGWDDASMAEVQHVHRWTSADVERLRRLRRRMVTIANTCPRCEDFANDARTVLAEQCAPDEQHCSCVPHLRAELARLATERDELRLTLLAERGDVAGAPEGWACAGGSWFRPLALPRHQAEVRRCVSIHPEGEPWYWAVYTPTLTTEGYAPTAREAMLAADRAWQEKA